MVRVVVARAARAALDELDYRRAVAVVAALEELERDAYAGYQLRGRLRGLRSHRVGVYRIIYELREDDQTVRVVAIRHRARAYETEPR